MDMPADSLDFINFLTAKQLQTVYSHFKNIQMLQTVTTIMTDKSMYIFLHDLMQTEEKRLILI